MLPGRRKKKDVWPKALLLVLKAFALIAFSYAIVAFVGWINQMLEDLWRERSVSLYQSLEGILFTSPDAALQFLVFVSWMSFVALFLGFGWLTGRKFLSWTKIRKRVLD